MAYKLPFPLADEAPIEQKATLPANHFLSLRPALVPASSSYASLPSSPAPHASTSWLDRAAPDTSTLAAADFDVSVLTGFLPPEPPIARIVGSGWELYEDCLRDAQDTAKELEGGGVGRLNEEWRERVRKLPLPAIEALSTVPLLRRAHVLLSFLGHFYVHSIIPALTVIPASISVPWVFVSDQLGLPPILTYADTVLWNWGLQNPQSGIRADNLTIDTTFTSSTSEKGFFLLSLLCELHAPPILHLMSSILDESFFADSLALRRISNYLIQIGSIVDKLTALMDEATRGVHSPASGDAFDDAGLNGKGVECDNPNKIVPSVFYWEIRPWFNGGKFFYEGIQSDPTDVDSPYEGRWMEWGGPSAGQSSLVHALDLFLGIDHAPRPSAPRSSSTFGAVHPRPAGQIQPKPIDQDSTFMLRASQYMPQHHRSFLRHLSSLHDDHFTAPSFPSTSLSSIPTLRTLALRYPSILSESYNTAIGAMKKFRDIHMKLVTVFIVTQARRPPGRDSIFWNEWHEKKRMEEEKKLEKEAEDRKKETLMGTGGTALVSFLKDCRLHTVEAFVQ